MLELARSTDRDAVEVIAKQAHAMHVQWRPDIYEMPEQLYTQERFQEAISTRSVYVAKISDTVIGYVHVRIRTYDWPGVLKRKVMLLDELAVHKDYRNQGYGTRILSETKVLARAFGCTDLQLSVYPQNDNAVAFYQKNGLMIRSIEMQMNL